MGIQNYVAQMIALVGVVHQGNLLCPGSTSFSMVLGRAYLWYGVGPPESQLSGVIPLPNVAIS
jgi:hypothetical protein